MSCREVYTDHLSVIQAVYMMLRMAAAPLCDGDQRGLLHSGFTYHRP